jgi:hypothetical protein
MALFQGEEMIDVTTPDGRTLTLPRSLVPASMMPQQPQQIAPQPGLNIPATQPPQELAPPTLAPPTDDAPADVVGGPLSTVEMGEPETQRVTPQQLRQEQAVLKAQQAQQLKTEKQRAARAATPQGQREGAETKVVEADRSVEKAVYSQTDLQAAEDQVVGEAIGTRNVKLNDLDAARFEDMEAHMAAEDAVRTRVNSTRDKIANTKIDRSADHPVLLSIFAAIAGIGEGMQGKEITTYKMIIGAIDRKVAAQEADLDRMGKIYGMTKDELDMLKERGKSKLEFHHAMYAAETDKAVRHIEELTARSASEKTKANANLIVAKLKQDSATRSVESMRWGLDFDQKEKHQKDQLRMQGAQLSQADRHHRDNVQLQRERMLFDKTQAIAADRAKGDAATAEARMKAGEEIEKRGMKGLGGEYLLTPEGRKKMEEAQKLEDEAQKLGSAVQNGMTRGLTQEQVQAHAQRAAVLQQKAAVIRDDAHSFHTVMARSDTQAGTMSLAYAAAQSMIDTVDRINQVYDEVGRQVLGRDAAQQELQTLYKLLNVKGKEAWQLGAWDKGSAKLSEDIFGTDPSAWAAKTLAFVSTKGTVGDDPLGYKDRLEAVAQDLQNTVNLKLQANTSWRGAPPELFTRKKPRVINEQTKALSQAFGSLELQKDREQGSVLKREAAKAAAGDPEESVKYRGMSRAQEAPFEERVRTYKAGGIAGKEAADDLVGTVAQLATKRPDYIIPLLHNLREFGDERIYNAARAAVPKGSKVDEQMTYEEQTRIGTAGEAPDMLGSTVLNSIKDDGTVGDKDGYRELARRAGTGDPMAKKAISSIVAASGSRKSKAQQAAAALDSMQRSRGKVLPIGYTPLKPGGR